MTMPTFSAAGPLQILPSPASSQNDFDFFTGKWNIRNKKLQSRLAHCDEWTEFNATQEMYKILNGFGNIDNFFATFDGILFEGMTLRLFDPITRLWSIYWADSNIVKLDQPVLGSFEGNIGRFFTKDIFNKKEILVQFKWDKTDPENPVWSQAFSDDNGLSWEWNWYMYMSRYH